MSLKPNVLVTTINQESETIDRKLLTLKYQVIWFKQLSFYNFFFFRKKMSLEIMLTEHTHNFNPTQYFNSIRCVGGYFKLTSFCVIFHMQNYYQMEVKLNILNVIFLKSLSVLDLYYQLRNAANIYPFLENEPL